MQRWEYSREEMCGVSLAGKVRCKWLLLALTTKTLLGIEKGLISCIDASRPCVHIAFAPCAFFFFFNGNWRKSSGCKWHSLRANFNVNDKFRYSAILTCTGTPGQWHIRPTALTHSVLASIEERCTLRIRPRFDLWLGVLEPRMWPRLTLTPTEQRLVIGVQCIQTKDRQTRENWRERGRHLVTSAKVNELCSGNSFCTSAVSSALS